MRAIDSGALMARQLMGDVKPTFGDCMSSDQRRWLRDLPKPVPQSPRPSLQRPRGTTGRTMLGSPTAIWLLAGQKAEASETASIQVH